jgi:hypothetical protein
LQWLSSCWMPYFDSANWKSSRPEESDIMQQMLTRTSESEQKCVNKPNIAIYALS